MDDVRELERTRLAQILRRWPRYGWDYLGRSRWAWSAEPFLGLGIIGALIATLYFEITLLTGKAEPWFAALQVLSMSLSPLTHSPSPSETGTALWFLFWIGLMALSWLLIRQPTPLARALELGFLLTPAWSLRLFLALGRWLLRPFTFRDLSNPRLPRRHRAILAGLALTVVVPLGGLFIPFWIYAHHRLWPGMEWSWAAARP